MKKILTRISYMAVGSLLTLIGYHFGNVDNNSADAQVQFDMREKTEIVDEIRCRKLVILGEDDTQRITLWADPADQGQIQVLNEDGAERILLGVASNIDSGVITINAKESGGTAVMLGVDSYGGFMSLWNKLIDTAIVSAGITNKGDGYVSTNDKAGYSTWNGGPKGEFIADEILRD